MKRLLKFCHKCLFCFMILVILQFLYGESTCNAETSTNITQESTINDVLGEQKSSLNIGEFINQAKKYTTDVFGDTDLNVLLNSAIKGEIDNSAIAKSILNILGKETVSSIRTIGLIIIIIVIHSILKSISEGLENKTVSQVTYYVQYILIVTLIMTNFADIISGCKEAINNLVGFSNTLVPVLMTLILSTRFYCIC